MPQVLSPCCLSPPHRCLATAGLVVSDGAVPSKAELPFAEREQQVVLPVPVALPLLSESQSSPELCEAAQGSVISLKAWTEDDICHCSMELVSSWLRFSVCLAENRVVCFPSPQPCMGSYPGTAGLGKAPG